MLGFMMKDFLYFRRNTRLFAHNHDSHRNTQGEK